MGGFIPRNIPEGHWHQLKANRAYAFKSDDDSAIHLRFGIGGMFLAIDKGEEGERVLSSIDMGDGSLTEISRFGQGKVLAVGRSSECQIRISHPILSRKHIEIGVEGDVLVVKDLGSTNGTYSHSENVLFDIDEYLSKHSLSQSSENTMDDVHEAFGPTIDDFLKKYTESVKKEGT